VSSPLSCRQVSPGSGQHKHSSEQIHVITSGTITIQLEAATRTATKKSTIFIP
jgi:quercetin dioxygenase-like cupin family protein